MAAPDNFTVTTWQAIYAANKDVIGNNPNLIYPGQVLTLSNDITYTVASGDNLTKIAAGRGGGSYGTPIVNSPVTQEILPPTPVKPLNSTTEEDTTGLDQGDTIPNPPDISIPDKLPEDKTETIKKITVDKSSTKQRWKEPRNNPLSDFSSYTYNISLYVVNPETYNSYTEGSKIIPADWKLICRSGGIGDFFVASNNVSERGSSRAEGFELDYYIDNLRLTTNISSQETKRASSTYEFSFQVFEPYGFKFPTKLVRAAHQAQKSSSIRNTPGIKNTNQALQSIMMLVIRFYGYNKDGELVTSTNYSKADSTVTDTDAVFERSFPIKITGFEFKLDSKIIYNIKATMVAEDISAGKFRGFVNSDTITLKGTTVSDMLKGSSKANTQVYGLIEYLNDKQEEYLKNKQIQIKDSYSIRFGSDDQDTSIKSADMVDPKLVDRSNAPNAKVENLSEVNAKTSAGSATVNTKIKTFTVNKGTEILRVIDQIITQSSYVTSAFTYNDSQKTEGAVDTEQNYFNNSESKELVWYSVTPEVKVKTDGWDELRNSYAYDITYIIRKYTIPYVRGLKVAKPGTYDGPIKRYKHLYLSNDNKDKTKHQKEIISYDQQYNLLYFNAGGSGSSAPMPNTSNSAPVNPGYVSGSDKTGAGDGWWDKSIGPVKTFLYSPGDQLNARITILGDPDYLVTATARGVKEQAESFYGEDGFSINPHAGQIFIEVDFRDVEDYNKQTGLLDPAQDDDILFWPYPSGIKDKIQGVAYMVLQVVSNFSKGVFTQDLKTVIPPFDYSEDIAPSARTETSAMLAGITTNSVAPSVAPPVPAPVNQPKPPSTYGPPSTLGSGTYQILNPPGYIPEPSTSEILDSMAYKTARLQGKSAKEAMDIARAALRNGTGNQPSSGFEPLPGFRGPVPGIPRGSGVQSEQKTGLNSVNDDASSTSVASVQQQGRDET